MVAPAVVHYHHWQSATAAVQHSASTYINLIIIQILLWVNCSSSIDVRSNQHLLSLMRLTTTIMAASAVINLSSMLTLLQHGSTDIIQFFPQQ